MIQTDDSMARNVGRDVQPSGTRDLARGRVLIVDRNAGAAERFAALLREASFDVVTCIDVVGPDSTVNIRDFDVAVVAANFTMDGPCATLRHLRMLHGRAILVAVSEHLSGVEAVIAYEAGADDCCSMRADPVVTEAKIRRAIQRSRGCKQCASTAASRCESYAAEIGPIIRESPMIDRELLTRFEERVLGVFLRERGPVVPIGRLMTEVWKHQRVNRKRLYEHVSTLRAKLARFGWTVANVRNEGYRLERSPGDSSQRSSVAQ
jgi:DNA-binding response OmpR family regulator